MPWESSICSRTRSSCRKPRSPPRSTRKAVTSAAARDRLLKWSETRQTRSILDGSSHSSTTSARAAFSGLLFVESPQGCSMRQAPLFTASKRLSSAMALLRAGSRLLRQSENARPRRMILTARHIASCVVSPPALLIFQNQRMLLPRVLTALNNKDPARAPETFPDTNDLWKGMQHPRAERRLPAGYRKYTKSPLSAKTYC